MLTFLLKPRANYCSLLLCLTVTCLGYCFWSLVASLTHWDASGAYCLLPLRPKLCENGYVCCSRWGLFASNMQFESIKYFIFLN